MTYESCCRLVFSPQCIQTDMHSVCKEKNFHNHAEILVATVQTFVTWKTTEEMCGSNMWHLTLSEQVIAQTFCTVRHLIKISRQEMHSTISIGGGTTTCEAMKKIKGYHYARCL